MSNFKVIVFESRRASVDWAHEVEPDPGVPFDLGTTQMVLLEELGDMGRVYRALKGES